MAPSSIRSQVCPIRSQLCSFRSQLWAIRPVGVEKPDTLSPGKSAPALLPPPTHRGGLAQKQNRSARQGERSGRNRYLRGDYFKLATYSTISRMSRLLSRSPTGGIPLGTVSRLATSAFATWIGAAPGT